MPVQAEILSVGTELLLGEITDTNAQEISARLKETGVFVYRRVTLGDNPARHGCIQGKPSAAPLS